MHSPVSPSEKRPSHWLIAVGFLWLLVTAFGLRVMYNYQNVAAASGHPPSVWPAASKISRSPGLSTVVVMAHPHCPCTRATIGELALLMTRLHGQATAAVVFIKFPGLPEKWEETDLWRSAQSIPGVSVLADPAGDEVQLFQAAASGQTMLYSPTGQLQFSGGITGSRGHSGDNAGRAAIVSFVSTGASTINKTSVFGCSLHDPQTRSANEE